VFRGKKEVVGAVVACVPSVIKTMTKGSRYLKMTWSPTSGTLMLLVMALSAIPGAMAASFSSDIGTGAISFIRDSPNAISFESDMQVSMAFMISVTQGSATITPGSTIIFNNEFSDSTGLSLTGLSVGSFTVTITKLFGLQGSEFLNTYTFTDQIYEKVSSTLGDVMIVTGGTVTVTVTLGSASTANFQIVILTGTATLDDGNQLSFNGETTKTFRVTPTAMGTLRLRMFPQTGPDASKFTMTTFEGVVKDPLIMNSTLSVTTLVLGVLSRQIRVSFQYPETTVFDLTVTQGV